MKTTYFIPVLFLSIFSASSSFAVGACQQFAGNYTVGSAGCFEAHDGGSWVDTVYSGMVIAAQSSDDNLSMFYKEGSNDGYTVSYVADGQEHAGDIDNSGKTYTATCDSNQIQSTRVGLFVSPMVMTFVKNSDGTFTLTETITGATPFTRSCSMVRN